MKKISLALAMVALLVACTAEKTTTETTVTDTTAATETATAVTDTMATATTDTAALSDTAAPASPVTGDVTATTTTTSQEKPMSYENKVAEIHTGKGVITVRFFPDKAPNHVKNFIDLGQSGFYSGTKFHRVIPGFMIQGGDPNTKTDNFATWGQGGGEKELKAEFNDIHHKRGILSMARSNDPNSASSQFFITVADAGFLDNKYTVFGEVLSGMDVADAIVSAPRNAQDRPNSPVAIEKVVIRDAKDNEKGGGK